MTHALPRTTIASTLAACALAFAPMAAHAQSAEVPAELRDVDVQEHLNSPVPRDAIFRDHTGRMVTLGQYLDGNRPVLLTLVYHRCTMLCSMVLNGVVNGMRDVVWTAGNQFRVVALSIDPRDTPADAATRRARVLEQYNRPGADNGMHFLVGDNTNIRRVADAVGWRYRYDQRQNEYAHPAAIMLLTPSGNIARYLYGIRYEGRDLRFGLLEASQGRSVTTVERFLMWCFHYDPHTRRYVLLARRIMQLGGALTAVVLLTFLGVLWRRERRARLARKGANPTRNNDEPSVPTLTPAQGTRG